MSFCILPPDGTTDLFLSYFFEHDLPETPTVTVSQSSGLRMKKVFNGLVPQQGGGNMEQRPTESRGQACLTADLITADNQLQEEDQCLNTNLRDRRAFVQGKDRDRLVMRSIKGTPGN